MKKGLITFDRQYAETVKEWLRMNKVFQLFEDEKLEAVNEAVNKAVQGKNKEFVEKMLLDGVEIIQIMKYTGMTRKQIEEIKAFLPIAN